MYASYPISIPFPRLAFPEFLMQQKEMATKRLNILRDLGMDDEFFRWNIWIWTNSYQKMESP